MNHLTKIEQFKLLDPDESLMVPINAAGRYTVMNEVIGITGFIRFGTKSTTTSMLSSSAPPTGNYKG